MYVKLFSQAQGHFVFQIDAYEAYYEAYIERDRSPMVTNEQAF